MNHSRPLAAFAAISLLATTAAAQDEIGTALPVTVDVLEPFDTTTATPSPEAWSCTGNSMNDVWYTFTASADYSVDVSTCNMATYDTRLAVYSIDCETLDAFSIACNDDASGCTGFTSFLSFNATAGTQYWVRVGGFNSGSMGTGDLLVTGPMVGTIPDECATAAAITPDIPEAFDTTVATPSLEIWACTANTPKDVWYTFTATADYLAEASTCGTANYDTRIEVFDACGMPSIACNDDGPGCAGFTSVAPFMAVTGTQYWIRVGGFNNTAEGQGDLLVTGPPSIVPNDRFNDRLPLLNGVPAAFDSTLATESPADPMFGCSSGASLDLWYEFTVPVDGSVTVDTEGSAFDTKLEVYRDRCGELFSVACDDDGGTGLLSSVTFAGTCGTVYYARVAGWNGASGLGMITAVFSDMQPNDDCIDAIPVGLGMTTYCNVAATDSLIDMGCVFNGEVSDVWFSFTSPSTCPITVDLSGSDYDTGMAIYSGDCMSLVQIGCDDDSGTGLDSLITFDATAGETYLLQIGGFNGAMGDGVMNITENAGIGTLVCNGEFNSTGVGASLKLTGSATAADNNLTISVNDLPLNSMGYSVHSMETNLVVNPGGSQGNLCIASFTMGRFAATVLDSGTTGSVSFSPDLTALPMAGGSQPALAGETRYFQHWYRDVDGMGGATSNFSSAEGITFN